MVPTLPPALPKPRRVLLSGNELSRMGTSEERGGTQPLTGHKKELTNTAEERPGKRVEEGQRGSRKTKKNTKLGPPRGEENGAVDVENPVVGSPKVGPIKGETNVGKWWVGILLEKGGGGDHFLDGDRQSIEKGLGGGGSKVPYHEKKHPDDGGADCLGWPNTGGWGCY